MLKHHLSHSKPSIDTSVRRYCDQASLFVGWLVGLFVIVVVIFSKSFYPHQTSLVTLRGQAQCSRLKPPYWHFTVQQMGRAWFKISSLNFAIRQIHVAYWASCFLYGAVPSSMTLATMWSRSPVLRISDELYRAHFIFQTPYWATRSNFGIKDSYDFWQNSAWRPWRRFAFEFFLDYTVFR